MEITPVKIYNFPHFAFTSDVKNDVIQPVYNAVLNQPVQDIIDIQNEKINNLDADIDNWKEEITFNKSKIKELPDYGDFIFTKSRTYNSKNKYNNMKYEKLDDGKRIAIYTERKNGLPARYYLFRVTYCVDDENYPYDEYNLFEVRDVMPGGNKDDYFRKTTFIKHSNNKIAVVERLLDDENKPVCSFLYLDGNLKKYKSNNYFVKLYDNGQLEEFRKIENKNISILNTSYPSDEGWDDYSARKVSKYNKEELIISFSKKGQFTAYADIIDAKNLGHDIHDTDTEYKS